MIVAKGYVGKKEIVFEIESIAANAHGVLAKVDKTAILCTTVVGGYTNKNFVPLSVNYIEKMSSINKIPGGYKRREGLPSDNEILTSRAIDRSLRAVISSEFRKEIQVIVQVLSYDGSFDLEALSVSAASISLNLAGVLTKKVAAAKVMQEKTKMLHSVSEVEEGVFKTVMIEAQGQKESKITISIEGIKDIYSESFNQACEFLKIQKDLIAKVKIKPLKVKIKTLGFFKKLTARFAAKAYFKTLLLRKEKIEINNESPLFDFHFNNYLKFYAKKKISTLRFDNRAFCDQRTSYYQKNFFDNLDSSVCFTRGSTQLLSTITKGDYSQAQSIESLKGDYKDNFIVHYNFLPFCVNEINRISLSRRDIGHANLIKKALISELIDNRKYTIRAVVDVLSADGSTSMSGVAATSIALVDARLSDEYVAGISVGLIRKAKTEELMVDLTALEDNYLSSMDCKVAGTKNYISAIQLDVKENGIDLDIFEKSLRLAHSSIKKTIDSMPELNNNKNYKQDELNRNDYQQEDSFKRKISSKQKKSYKIDPNCIKFLIGKKGETINYITKECNVKIDVEKDGTVFIESVSLDNIKKCIDYIENVLDNI